MPSHYEVVRTHYLCGSATRAGPSFGAGRPNQDSELVPSDIPDIGFITLVIVDVGDATVGRSVWLTFSFGQASPRSVAHCLAQETPTPHFALLLKPGVLECHRDLGIVPLCF
jgi:hypothetical protein